MRSERHQGFTLYELLVVVAIAGTVAAVAVPLLSSPNAKKLDVAAEEVGNALRFAIDRGRTGAYVLVDAKTVPGRLKVVTSNASGADLGPINDPLTKRALDIDIVGGPFSGSVSMSPKFMGGGTPYAQLLIGPNCCVSSSPAQLQAFDAPTIKGALQSGSGIELSLGVSTVTVTLNEITGFVGIP